MLEPLEVINERLALVYGKDIGSSKPIFRVVWSDDEFENRFGIWEDYTENHVFIREVKETRRVPKYPWSKARYILEQLVAVPEVNKVELAGTKISYEPLWVFEDKWQQPLAPKWEACEFIINTLREKLGKKLPPRKDPEMEPAVSSEEEFNRRRMEKADRLSAELFGNETPITDALGHRTGIVVPQNYGNGMETD